MIWRLLPLVCIFFWASSSQAAQKITLEGELYQYDKQSQIFLYKNPRVLFEAGELSAHRLKYNKQKKTLEFEGSIALRAKDFLLTAQHLTYDLNTKKLHAAQIGLYDYINQTYITAETLVQSSHNQFELTSATLTLCRPEAPAWQLQSSFIDYEIDNYGYSLNTLLLFYKLPLFYLPAMAWPTKKGRASGFLSPNFMSKQGDLDPTKNYGYRVQIPYYWAIDKAQDVTITADWMQNRGLGKEIDYRWAFLPGMSGSFDLWNLDETNHRDLTKENLGGLTSQNINNQAKRYSYQLNHRQRLAGGQLFLHQEQRSDNEVEKDYKQLRIGLQNSFVRSASWVFPWSSGSLSLGHEYSSQFRYTSRFDRATDYKTHLNRDSYGEINQGFDHIFGSNLTLNTQASTANYKRINGWSGNLAQQSVKVQYPFHLNFLNILPRWKTQRFTYSTEYNLANTESSNASFNLKPTPFSWDINRTTIETNLELFKIYTDAQGRGKSRLGIRPRIIFDQVSDVDQRKSLYTTPKNHQFTSSTQTTGPAQDYARFRYMFTPPIYSYKTLTYKLDSLYLTKDTKFRQTRSFLSFNLSQTFNLGRKNTTVETWAAYRGPQVPESLQETKPGNQKMPLKINLTLSPLPQYEAQLFYRYDHEVKRVIENRVTLKTQSITGDSLSLNYIKNTKAYMDLDGTPHAQTNSYGVDQSIQFYGRNRLQLSALWDLSRKGSHTATQVKRLDRQLSEAALTFVMGHQCFDYQISYLEKIHLFQQGGSQIEGLDRQISFSMTLAKWPSTFTPYQYKVGL